MAIDKFAGLNDALAEARVRHPGWGFWISNAGRYWATRRSNVQIAEHSPPGWAMTIDADSLAELEEGIEGQKALSSSFSPALPGSRAVGNSADGQFPQRS
jgi:hypothetical protein